MGPEVGGGYFVAGDSLLLSHPLHPTDAREQFTVYNHTARIPFTELLGYRVQIRGKAE